MQDLMNFDIPVNRSSIIKVIGVGGGGSNAVNHMFRRGIKDVDFVICNTDAQALANSPVPVKIQLGSSLTEGRGAGNKPAIGREAAIENLDDIIEVLANNTKMIFITAGMGGGTGTGAAPVIAKAAQELGILTVAIVTIPFRNEGQRRVNQAMEGIAEIEKYVDSLLIINNEKIREIYGDLKVSEAFARADDVIAVAAKGIAEIITVHGYINVDFADVETVMTKSGVAIMGSGTAEGDKRAIDAVQTALNSPLLNDNNISGARNILINITSGTEEATMDEIGQITDYIQSCAGDDADLIWGNGMDANLIDAISVTVIATGFETNSIPEIYLRKRQLDKVTLEKNFTIEEQHNAEEKTGFEVREKKPERPRESNVVTQRTIEFDLSRESATNELSTNSNLEKNFVTKKAADRVKTLKRNYEQMKELNLSNRQRLSNIEELENQPAYQRKKVQLDKSTPSTEKKVSRFSLEDDDEEGGVRLSNNNRYLHENVD
ncbi:MAG: cell division protein FtsZ [Bacteroidales bacterium]|nr:cell division protein FtsZ [Bacteroidales bacterium]MBN2817978.1 cell division protein FtsZ [Bacteroidales bacterium]